MEVFIGFAVIGVVIMLISSNGKITTCGACDGKVSKQAHTCPHCGHPQ